ncbi:hypothetical protein B1C78_14690 [Thioalkalivibrio denitrificans]|uniref:Uncharacterized protein n=1 Tax=Thioalkalivibrio denitrificans TaxID=108003 RepID=A0A1V3NCA1_9GAMM|nr:hypothetical protein B1C78_14690 [Thioalkalivibrio denitrificans]
MSATAWKSEWVLDLTDKLNLVSLEEPRDGKFRQTLAKTSRCRITLRWSLWRMFAHLLHQSISPCGICGISVKLRPGSEVPNSATAFEVVLEII